MDKQRIKEEADAFFEWPSDDRTYVTTTSMLIFAGVIAEMAGRELRGALKADEERMRIAAERAGVTFLGCDTPDELADEVQRLKREIRLTLEENRHLADGDVCTLSRLKSAITT